MRQGWSDNPRWVGIERSYTAEDVLRLRGTIVEEHTLARRGADVVVHSAHIVHAGTDNTDPDGVMRLSTDIRYQRSSESIDWRWQEHWH